MPGEAPCSFVLRGTLTSESELGRILAAVDRIEVEAGGACVPHVVFDAASDVRPDPDGPSGPLEATLLPSPGRLGDESDAPPPVFVDVNFDGALDLRVVAQSGMSASFMRYWLYDPTTRRFVPNVALEELVNPYFDTKTRRIRSGGRGGANVYYSYEHEWVGGELVQAWSEEIHQGSTPAGQPLPAGFSRYMIRHQRRGTKQLKVFEGPAR